jgi:Tfp pilus assembly protein FimT
LIEELPMISPRESNDTVRPGQTGFTLIELAVALGVTTIVMLGILFLFDFNNKLARVQTNVADMQQSLRIAQYDMVRLVRMAGRGGLNATQGVVITRDVGADVHLIAGDDDSPKILEGTDVLTVRGVIGTPIYQVSFTNPQAYVLYAAGGAVVPPNKPEDAETGIVEICRLSPAGTIQDLEVIKDRLDQGEALILVSPMGDDFYAVVKLKPGTSLSESAATCPPAPDGGQTGLTVGFTITSEYKDLGAPTDDAKLVALSRVAYVGFLEEYRFYVREDHAVANDEDSELTPVLSRARFYPGTPNPYDDDAGNLEQDIADGILDLQIAMGLDVDGDGLVKEDLVLPGEDEWLGNAEGEAAIDGGLKNLRISTLARTTRLDHDYSAPDLTAVEDHPYTLTTSDRLNGRTARHFRRRLLQTIVSLRNITT